MNILVFLSAFIAAAIGSLCGIGGGVVIKPVMDVFSVADTAVINFLSGCTMLCMSGYSVIRNKVSGDSVIDAKLDYPLAIGAAFGGVLGRALYNQVALMFSNQNMASAVQALVLFVVTFGILLYTLHKSSITSRHITGVTRCLLVGGILGICSSFLGIGGGPINLAVLFYLFSMPQKRAAQSSLFIILCAQLTSTSILILQGVHMRSECMMIVGMGCCGILGGIVGQKLNRKVDEKFLDVLFLLMMVVIMGICAFNVLKYLV